MYVANGSYLGSSQILGNHEDANIIFIAVAMEALQAKLLL